MTVKRLLCLISLSIFLVTESVFATDLLPIGLILDPSTPYKDSSVAVSLRIRNQNRLDATNYSVKIEIFRPGFPTEYQQVLTGMFLQKYHDSTYSVTEKWVPQFRDEYRARITVTYVDDIDNSNNVLDTNFSVLSNFHITPAEAVDLMFKWLEVAYPKVGKDTELEILSVPNVHVDEGTKIVSNDSTELKITLPSSGWLGWYRSDKYARYTSDNMLLWLADGDSSPVAYPVSWWVNVDGVSIDSLIRTPGTVATGSAPASHPLADTNTIASSVAPSGDSEIVVLVSGHDNDPRMQKSFDDDLHMYDVNLRLERYGPHVSASNIIQLHDPTKAEVLATLDGIPKGRYKKIWFVYSGHGDTSIIAGKVIGAMCLGDHYIYYDELFDHLYGTQIPAVTVLLDACHSGSVVQTVKDDPRTETHDVVVIAACQTGETSNTFYAGADNNIGFGGFSLYWLKCFGDPAAEEDGIPGISEEEALDCLRRSNPELPIEGKHLFDYFHPRSYFHTAEKNLAKGTTTTVPNTSVSVTPQYDISPSTTVSISLTSESKSYMSNYSMYYADSSIDSVSYGRLWKLSIDPKPISYKFDLQFAVNDFDSLKGAGTPGVIHREDSTKPWSVHTPYSYDPNKRLIKLYNVTRFSEWALAMVSKPQAGVQNERDKRSSGLLVYSNSTNDEAALKLTLSRAGGIVIALFDELGRKVTTIAEGQFPAGVYRMPFSTSSFASGAYTAILSVDGETIASSRLAIAR